MNLERMPQKPIEINPDEFEGLSAQEAMKEAESSWEESMKWGVVATKAKKLLEAKYPDRKNDINLMLHDDDFKKKSMQGWTDQEPEALASGLSIRVEEELNKNRSIN